MKCHFQQQKLFNYAAAQAALSSYWRFSKATQESNINQKQKIIVEAWTIPDINGIYVITYFRMFPLGDGLCIVGCRVVIDLSGVNHGSKHLHSASILQTLRIQTFTACIFSWRSWVKMN